MKVIDLLNKIANGEEVPKKIKYNDKIYIAKGNAIENFVDYYSDEDEWCFNHYVKYENLNDEVEIIEEPQEHKIPEKLPYYSLEKIQKAKNKDEWREERISLLEERINDYHNKINEILDYLEVNNE